MKRREKILAMLETEAVCGGYLVAGLTMREATRQEVIRLAARGVISIRRTTSSNNFLTALIAIERPWRDGRLTPQPMAPRQPVG